MNDYPAGLASFPLPILLICITSCADNIKYGRPDASDEQVEAAARAANALSFVSRLPEKFDTKVRPLVPRSTSRAQLALWSVCPAGSAAPA